MKFFIYEGNQEACEKEMMKIKRKCANAGIPFIYRLTGRETFKKYGEEPNTINVRFIEVEAEGKIKWNGWNVIARIEHKDGGNLVYSMIDTPDTKWWTMDSFCDHCGTNRARNQEGSLLASSFQKKRRNVTYILEDKDGNRKQVGSTCLKEFTNGLDAEALAKYFEIYNMDERDTYIPTTKTVLYLKTKDVLSAYIRETEENGFVKSDGEKPTRLSGRRYFGTDNKNMDKVEAVIKFYEAKDDDSDFIMNVKAVLRNEYCDFSMFGILACLWHCYTRELERIEREQQRKEVSKISKHLYEKDQKIQIEVTGKIVTSFENFYGETVRVYRFTDREGNVYTWKTSCWIGEEIRNGGWFIIRGTVKENSVYMGESRGKASCITNQGLGEKQTVLVRVKVVK